VDRPNLDLAFAHSPGLDSLGFGEVRVWVRLGIDGLGFDGPGFDRELNWTPV